jgi:7-cyano-7-deazaguanine reductase
MGRITDDNHLCCRVADLGLAREVLCETIRPMAKTSRPSTKNTALDTSLSAAVSGADKSLTLLGGGPLPRVASPDEAPLESFESPSPRDYEVTFFTREFTSHCPVTGQPDYAEITIRYTPNHRCIESKSLKHYLGSYRNQAVFAEGIVNRILNDVVTAIAPRRAVVIGDFSPRGGIGIRVEAAHEGPGVSVRPAQPKKRQSR